jgi:hypothetical protein
MIQMSEVIKSPLEIKYDLPRVRHGHESTFHCHSIRSAHCAFHYSQQTPYLHG